MAHQIRMALVFIAALAIPSDGRSTTVAPLPTSLLLRSEARAWRNPGTNPCGLLCDREWALEEMVSAGVLPHPVSEKLRHAIDESEPVPFYVSSGDEIAAMTYAKNGTPYLDPSPRVAQFADGESFRSEGYFVTDGEAGYWFIKIEHCGNWALLPSEFSPLFEDIPLTFSPGGIGTNSPTGARAPASSAGQASSRISPSGGGVGFPSFLTEAGLASPHFLAAAVLASPHFLAEAAWASPHFLAEAA